MEIDYNQLKEFFSQLEIEEAMPFEYMDRPFTIWFAEYTENERKEGRPAIFYSFSNVDGGFDIYTPELSEIFIRPILIHECIEALVNDERTGTGSITPKQDYIIHQRAHELAKKYDEMYAQDTLSPEQFIEYIKIKEEYKEASPDSYINL
jgi:hypothetical protein|tara:strand:+ start:135 stop:584 length:450 start_codon:yes stop_codon:yes gene_type:complete